MNGVRNLHFSIIGQNVAAGLKTGHYMLKDQNNQIPHPQKTRVRDDSYVSFATACQALV
jgi:hypothetical protein